MCGIGGILRTDGQPIPEEWLDAIDARIAYRGPDGHGRFRDRVEIDDPNAPGGKRVVEVAFVHRRLSIIDHKDGAQPMVSERGRNEKEGLVAVVFNGCIYNHRELRKELESKGHTFVTDHSDTEVLIHGWREWGEAISERLEGMYAFAIWDRTLSSLLLSRDEFGEKPLYYRDDRQRDDFMAARLLAFASVPTALSEPPPRAHRRLSTLELLWTQALLQTGVTHHSPLWDWASKEANPAESLRWKTQRLHRVAERTRKEIERPVTSEQIESLLSQAVARRLEADVPLGCFVSGGIDSSLVAILAKRCNPDLHTFCVRMPDDRYDESSFAKQVADRLGTHHTTLDVAVRPADDLVHLVGLMGQPFGDSSLLPTYWVSRSASEHVKVALSGDGGDEMFVGYERYKAAPLLAKYWRVLRRLPVRSLHRLHTKSRFNKLARLRDMANDYPSLGVAAMESVFTIEEIADLTNESPFDLLKAKPDTVAQSLQTLREFDIRHYLPDDLLRKVDTASMACGLEVRCPFLDRDLARAALAAPIEQLMPGGQRKGLLRQIARKYLPREIVDRPKVGFAIPIGEWFRSDYGGMKTLLLDHLNSTEPFGPIQLNRKAVQRFIDEHMSGKRDHGQRLFTLLTLSIWARQVTGDK